MIKKIKTLLTKDEELIRVARVHGIVFAPPITYTLIGVCVWIFFNPVVGGAILVMTLYPVYTSFIHYTMTRLVLTNKKVLARVGFLTRDWMQMAFDKIENVYLEEPIIGRYLGYSTVVISGVGAGTIAVPYVAYGDFFVERLQKELDDSREHAQEPTVVINGDDLIKSLEKHVKEGKVA
jgi:uncharacterized membrane protein YdbT with pleckstrin-like domain